MSSLCLERKNRAAAAAASSAARYSALSFEFRLFTMAVLARYERHPEFGPFPSVNFRSFYRFWLKHELRSGFAPSVAAAQANFAESYPILLFVFKPF